LIRAGKRKKSEKWLSPESVIIRRHAAEKQSIRDTDRLFFAAAYMTGIFVLRFDIYLPHADL